MTPERHQRIIELFHSASAFSHDHRESFIDESCAGDEELREDVYAMLAADKQAVTFLEKPPADVAAAVMAGMKSQPVIGQTLGDYRVIAPLGSGGMGEVFLAEDTRLGRRAALKLLPREYTTDSVRLREFEQEARAVSALNHPNIVTVYGIGQAGVIHFLATEYVAGSTLREQVAKGPLASTTVINIGVEIACALDAAHRAGIVHRDIKPENIIVRPDGVVKIFDFGIAQRIEPPEIYRALTCESERAAVPGLVIGTPAYMSPEQARGLPVDARTDIFSLGCVLFELVSGRPAVTGHTPSDVIASTFTEQPIPIACLGSICPPALLRVIGKATEKHRDKRYQTSAELLAD